MEYLQRLVEANIVNTLKRNKSIILLGPRQTGKTTLLTHLKPDYTYSFIKPNIRQRYERDPSLLYKELAAKHEKTPHLLPLVAIDEVQKVPVIMDVIQDLIDNNIAKFIITGSSLRKLKRGADTNLLPGRVVKYQLDPLMYDEIPVGNQELLQRMLYGSLPAILRVTDPVERETDLESYVSIYLEEEIRAEALVRNLDSFGRFLELAAAESGNITNYSNLSQQIGVAHRTITAYYQILEDCLIGERIEPITKSQIRNKLTKSPKFLFYDLGVRRVSAREGINLPLDYLGRLFEQYVGLELVRMARLGTGRPTIQYWRDPQGPEVDWVISYQNKFVPIEVKWSEAPHLNDARHLQTFISEYPESTNGYIVCRTPARYQLSPNITCVNWTELAEIMSELVS